MKKIEITQVDELVIAWAYLTVVAYEYCERYSCGDDLAEYSAAQLVGYEHFFNRRADEGALFAHLAREMIGPEDFCRDCGHLILSGKLRDKSHNCPFKKPNRSA